MQWMPRPRNAWACLKFNPTPAARHHATVQIKSKRTAGDVFVGRRLDQKFCPRLHSGRLFFTYNMCGRIKQKHAGIWTHQLSENDVFASEECVQKCCARDNLNGATHHTLTLTIIWATLGTFCFNPIGAANRIGTHRFTKQRTFIERPQVVNVTKLMTRK